MKESMEGWEIKMLERAQPLERNTMTHRTKQKSANIERADRACNVLGFYRLQHNMDDDDRTCVIDLLTDLMHEADRQEINMDDAIRLAKMHHDSEKVREYY